MWCNWNPCALLLELKSGAATVENSLVVSQKVKHRISMWPSSSTPKRTPRGTESRCSSRCLYWWHWFTVQVSTNWWMDKTVWGAQAMEYYSATKRNGVIFKMGGVKGMECKCTLWHGWALEMLCWVKEARCRGCMIPFTWVSAVAKPWDSEQIGSCWGGWKGEGGVWEWLLSGYGVCL